MVGSRVKRGILLAGTGRWLSRWLCPRNGMQPEYGPFGWRLGFAHVWTTMNHHVLIYFVAPHFYGPTHILTPLFLVPSSLHDPSQAQDPKLHETQTKPEFKLWLMGSNHPAAHRLFLQVQGLRQLATWRRERGRLAWQSLHLTPDWFTSCMAGYPKSLLQLLGNRTVQISTGFLVSRAGIGGVAQRSCSGIVRREPGQGFLFPQLPHGVPPRLFRQLEETYRRPSRSFQ